MRIIPLKNFHLIMELSNGGVMKNKITNSKFQIQLDFLALVTGILNMGTKNHKKGRER